jgi:Putative auto-transporter adhesin, head GIN domain
MIRKLPLLFIAVALAGCDFRFDSSCSYTASRGGTVIKGSGSSKTEARLVAAFSSIQLSSCANVEIERTGSESLSVTADDNLLSVFLSEVKGGALLISYDTDKSFKGTVPIYKVTTGDLRSVTMSGSGDVKASKLAGESFSISISGSGDIRVAGEVAELVVDISGSGDVNAIDLKAKRAKISISGSGDATVNAADELDVSISGSGDVSYIGKPRVTSKISGSGSLNPK